MKGRNSLDMLIVICAVVMLITGQEQKWHNNPIILKDRGIVMEPDGGVALGTYTTLQSIFLKVEEPKMAIIGKDCRTMCEKSHINTTAELIKERCITKNKMPSWDKRISCMYTRTEERCIQGCINMVDCNTAVWFSDQTKFEDCNCEFYREVELKYNITRVTSYNIDCMTKKTECQGSEFHLNAMFRKSMEQEMKVYWEKHLSWFTKVREVELLMHASRKRMVNIIPFIGNFLGASYNTFIGYLLKKEIKRVEADFKRFKAQTSTDFKDIKNNILMTFKKIESDLKKEAEHIDCKTNILALQLLQAKEIRLWRDSIEEILTWVIKGQIRGNIIPAVLSPEDIQLVVNNSPDLNETIYVDNPTYLYAVGKLSVVEMTKIADHYIFHLVVDIPHIRPENLFKVFKIKQTGIFVNGTCINFKLPRTVYELKGHLLEIDLDICRAGNFIKVCAQNIDKERIEVNQIVPCLSDNITDCEVETTKCLNTVVYTKAGLLVKSNKPVYAQTRNSQSIVDCEPEGNHVQYFDWGKFSLVQHSEGIITSRDHQVTMLYRAFTTTTYWNQVIALKTRDKEEEENEHLLEKITDVERDLEKEDMTPWETVVLQVIVGINTGAWIGWSWQYVKLYTGPALVWIMGQLAGLVRRRRDERENVPTSEREQQEEECSECREDSNI